MNNGLKSLFTLPVFILTSSAWAANFQPGNILISSQNVLHEYSADNVLVSQEVIPLNANNEVARDLLVLEDGRLAVFNGTFYPELAIYDGVSWQSITVSGWSIPNNLSYGGIASIANKVFVTDGYTGSGGEAKGLIEINLDTGVSNRFIADRDYIDVTLGGDGLLYALQNTYGVVDVVDPASLAILRSVALGHTSASRGVAANANGEIFMVSWDGYIAHYDENGLQVNTLTIGGDLHDIDLDETGRLIVGSRFGQVYVTDESLADFTEIVATSMNTFAAFVPPEAPLAAPVISGSHSRKGRWITTTLTWATEAPAVDVYFNNILIDTLTSTTATYKYNKKISQTFVVCNTGTQDCSEEYIAN